MPRIRTVASLVVFALGSLAVPSTSWSQYAVAHRTFGAGTSFGGGYWKMDYKFPGIDPAKPMVLLPTLELKVFLSDTVSIDLSVPVGNIAASNALQDYFFVTGEAYLNFHPSAPSSVELFVAPGFGVSYASWKGEIDNFSVSQSGYAFHIPVRVGLEFNNMRRNFSFIIAARPFFSLVHGGSDTVSAGGGGMIELGLMAYASNYRADRY